MTNPEPAAVLDLETTGPPSLPDGAVLSVRDLRVEFPSDDGVVKAVDGISFDVFENEVLGIVGESGSGKSVTSMAALGLLPRYARISGGVYLRGVNLLEMHERDLQKLRGEEIAMVFQDALASLNPVYTVGNQIAEAITTHHDKSKSEVRERVVELLDLVGIPSPRERADQYPHEFSGGMRQRAMIAMTIANDPQVLIADEPTTALDVTIQAQVLEVLERIQERTNSAIILITHDLGVVAGMADRVMVMYAGRQAELSSVDDIFYEPCHPYTRGLLASLPRLDIRQRRRAALPHQGSAAVAHQRAVRVRVPPALRARAPAGPLRHRAPRASPCGLRREPQRGVPLRRDVRECVAPDGRGGHLVSAEAQSPPVTKPDTHGDVLLEVVDLVKEFPIRAGHPAPPGRRGAGRERGRLHRAAGETLGLVGESGAASRRRPAASFASSPRHRDRCCSTASTSSRSMGARCAASGARCRSSSRTRMRRSTLA